MQQISEDLLSRDSHKPDITRRSALTLGDWRPQDAVDYAIEYYDIGFEFGNQPEYGSTRYAYFVDYTDKVCSSSSSSSFINQKPHTWYRQNITNIIDTVHVIY